MGILWTWFMGKDTDKLLKMEEKCDKKIQKYETKKNAIQLELSRRKGSK